MEPESIGNRLRQYALSEHGSLKAFSDAIGMHPGNVQKYINDKREPGAKLLKTLLDDGLNVQWLLTGEGGMFANSNLLVVTAAGAKMTPDCIKEGDSLFIDVGLSPEPGDYVLKGTEGAPAIAEHTHGDSKPIGVVVELRRKFR